MRAVECDEMMPRGGQDGMALRRVIGIPEEDEHRHFILVTIPHVLVEKLESLGPIFPSEFSVSVSE